ncbi:MAG: nitronate monooxygenase family protein [bacterium]
MSRAELPPLNIGAYSVKKPIFQGGMSIGISGAELATAATKAEGIGTIGGVGLGHGIKEYAHLPFFKANRQALLDELHKAKEIDPNGVWGVNLLAAIKGYDALVRTALKGGAKFIVSGAGLPLNLPELTKDYPEVALIPIVSSAQGVRVITKWWLRHYERQPDAIIIEEPSTAGGHLGVTSSQTIYDSDLLLVNAIPESRKWLDDHDYNIPIIAAGGIYDRSDIDRMLALGAKGIQMGTRFVCTHESGASEEFKQKYLNAKEEDIVLVESPVGIPGRAIRTEFSQEIERGERPKYKCAANCLEVCNFRSTKGDKAYCIMDALHNSRVGNSKEGIVFAGSNAYRSKEQGIVSVRQIFDELTAK